MTEPSTPDKPKNRRKPHSLLFSPRLQLKYGMYYMGVGLVTVIIANFCLIYILIQAVKIGNRVDTGTKISEILVATLQNNIQPLALGSTLVCLLLLFFALIMTKHVVGPMHALLKHIEELKKGNYSYKTTLRSRDELKPLMESLNELSDQLKKRSN